MSRTYTLTCQSVIDKVRYVTNDVKPTTQRTTDDEVIGWINDCIATAVSILPSLFSKTGIHSCQEGVLQTLELGQAHKLIDVLGVPPADAATLTSFNPGWTGDAFGPIQNWMPLSSSPLSFMCYPPSQAAQLLPVLYAEKPLPLDAPSDLIPLPESYEPAVVSYCVGMTESKDDESVNSNRAQAFMADFAARIKGV